VGHHRVELGTDHVLHFVEPCPTRRRRNR
jgi:hypothetical protein